MRSVITGLIMGLGVWGFGAPAAAQYLWLDEKGIRQYSDRPPPTSVPNSRILRMPVKVAAAAGATPAPTSVDAAPQSVATTSLADKNAEFNKRRAEQMEKEKKLAEETRVRDDHAKNCERARNYHKSLASGERVAQAGKNGESVYMNDEQHAQEIRDTKRILAECK